MEAEKKLAEYRAKKKRQQQIEKYKEKFKSMFTWSIESTHDSPESEVRYFYLC